MKFVCLNCGRFFTMEHPLIAFETICPYCKDSYFTNNVIPDIPPDIADAVKIDFSCGHSMVSDMIKDIVACPVCGLSANFTEGMSLREWQNNQIKRIGI